MQVNRTNFFFPKETLRKQKVDNTMKVEAISPSVLQLGG